MPVVESHIMSAAISGEVTGDGQSDEQTGYTVRWFVKCDSPLDTPPVVIEHFRRASDKPFIGDPYEAGNGRDSNAICKGIRPTLVDRSGGIYHVDVTYEPKDGGSGKEEKPSQSDPGKTTSDPLQWLDEIETTSQNRSVPVWVGTYQGCNPEHILNEDLEIGSRRMPCNSALKPFSPGLEMDLAIEVIRITKLRIKYDQTLASYINRVNSDDFLIHKPLYEFRRQFEKYKVKLASCPQSFTVINNFPYWRTTYEFHINPLPYGWRDEIADMGFDVRKKSGARLPNGTTVSFVAPNEECWIPATGPDGQTLSEPVALDGRGGMAGPDDPPVFLIWQKYEERAFAPLAHTL